MWISLPCSPWCSWQRVNQAVLHNYAEVLEEKRRESLKLVERLQNILDQVHEEVEAYFEWPKGNEGWKQKKVIELTEKLKYEVNFDGCAYDLKDSEGRPLKKPWKVVSNQEKITKFLNKVCQGHEHGQVRGKAGKETEEYTPKIIEEIIDCMIGKSTAVKPMKAMTKAELKKHQEEGHFPFDQRCEHCLKGGMRDRRHPRRKDQ